MSFWGLVVDSGKRYHQTVERSFHVSMAALDLSENDKACVQLMLTSENKNYLLCTLSKHMPQSQLDMNFLYGEKIAFSCNGNGSIHLTGYLVPEDDPSDSSTDDEEETPELVSAKNCKRKKLQGKCLATEGPQKKKKKLFEIPDESEDSDYSDDSDEYEDVEEEEAFEKSPQPNGKMEVEKKKKKKDKPKQNEKKNKNTEKNVATVKQNENKKTATTPKQKLEGGVIIEDLKIGTGTVAKPGKMVQVYYEGRLKSNNKVFDSAKNGRGFQFRLGRQEVIKGWDVALVGMRVGGKRKIICPPNMAYGAKGSPPVIPANSTLVFEVELKNIN